MFWFYLLPLFWFYLLPSLFVAIIASGVGWLFVRKEKTWIAVFLIPGILALFPGSVIYSQWRECETHLADYSGLWCEGYGLSLVTFIPMYIFSTILFFIAMFWINQSYQKKMFDQGFPRQPQKNAEP
jgi:uncharacterized membrane protein YjjB (DUF3815 family)